MRWKSFPMLGSCFLSCFTLVKRSTWTPVKSLHICLLMLIKIYSPSPRQETRRPDFPRFLRRKKKPHYQSLFFPCNSALLRSAPGAQTFLSVNKRKNQWLIWTSKKFIANQQNCFHCAGTTMDENQLRWKYTGLSKQQEQMKWAAGFFWMISPSGVTFSFLFEGPWGVWKPLSSLQKFNFSL